MIEYITRPLQTLIAAILATANRLTRLAVIQHEVDAYVAAYEEAKSLEAAGKPQLARFVRAQIDETLGGALGAGGAPAVNGDGPFELPRPTPAGLSPPNGQGNPRRRGRRPAGADGVQQLELPRENPADPTDPMSLPTTTPDQQP